MVRSGREDGGYTWRIAARELFAERRELQRATTISSKKFKIERNLQKGG
jgi:hypothetical protein